MVLLPIAGSLGVLLIPEIILVLRLGQPSPHEVALPGLAAIGFEAVALALSTPVIGKKKFLAVQALASGLRRLHRFQNEKEPVSETGVEERKKIQPQEKSERRRRKKNFQRICRRKSTGRRSHSKPPSLHPFDFARGNHNYVGHKRCTNGIQKYINIGQGVDIVPCVSNAILSSQLRCQATHRHPPALGQRVLINSHDV